MSVLIKGMEMPKNCNGCRFFELIAAVEAEWYGSPFNCKTTGAVIADPSERDPNCPLVEVHTSHGRLIDADEFCRAWDKEDHSAEYEHCSTLFAVDESPTIIEAEEETK